MCRSACACHAARWSGDAVPAADAAPVATPAPVAAAAAPAAPAAPVAVPAAAPAAAAIDVAALAAVQRGVEDLRAASVNSASELKAAQQATDSKVAALAAAVEAGLAKLHAADAVQTAADEAQAKAAGAAGSSTDSHKATASALEKIEAATKARLESVEKELAELKKMLATFVNAERKAVVDPAIAEIKAQTSQILAQLANATAAWSFDHEQILAQIKTTSYSLSTRLTKFAQKTYASVMANYPSYAAQARELMLQGADHAQVLGGQAQLLSADAHLKLTQLLQANGVPKEFVQYAALSILALVALLLTMLLWSILKCLCRCCCCRSGKVPAAKGGKAAKASK